VGGGDGTTVGIDGDGVGITLGGGVGLMVGCGEGLFVGK
jgi:hypothetical protein